MSRFSLIVPLLGETSQFENTLASVLRYRTDACQVIVAHDENYQDPHGLSREVDFVPITGVKLGGRRLAKKTNSEIVRLFNAAVRQSRGEYVGLLRPGVQLEDGWYQPIVDAFADPNVGSAAPSLLAQRTADRLVTSGVLASAAFNRKLRGVDGRYNERQLKKLTPVGPTSWAGFYRRSLLTSLGDCDETLDSNYFDLDLALSLSALNFKCVFCHDCIVTVNDPDCVLEESRASHGRSAQRSFVRFTELTNSQRRMRLAAAAIMELAVAPWCPANIVHAFQRLNAERHIASDTHHRDLLNLLLKQRQRLLRPSLQLQKASSNQASQLKSHALAGNLASRRAA